MNPLLGRWISADPLAVHAPGEADLNVYAYVHGQILKNIDPLGLADGPVSEEKQAPANGSAHEGPVDTTSKSYLDSFTDWSYDVDSGNFTLSYEGGEKVTVSADEIVGKSSTGKEHYEDLNKGAHYRDGVVAPGKVTSETAPELYAVKDQVEKTLAWMRTDAGLDAMMKYFPALVGMNASGLSIGALVGGSMKGSSLAIKPTRTQVRSSVAEIAPQQIRFSQRSVNGAGELTKSMKQHGWKGDPIDVVKMGDGKLTTLDNTRVLAASRAGVKVKAKVHKADDPLPESLVERFSTKNGSPKTWGEAVNLRIQKQGAAYQKQNPNGSSATGTTD